MSYHESSPLCGGSCTDIICTPRHQHTRQYTDPSAKSPFDPRYLPFAGSDHVIRNLYHNFVDYYTRYEQIVNTMKTIFQKNFL